MPCTLGFIGKAGLDLKFPEGKPGVFLITTKIAS